MKKELQEALLHCETDLDGVLQRFYGSEELYISLLDAFVEEPTMAQLSDAVESRDWGAAFIAAHALKGLAANMGFVPLFHTLAELVLILRAGKYGEVAEAYIEVKSCYSKIIFAIKQGK